MTDPRSSNGPAAFMQTVMWAKRYGKATISKLIMQPYLERGDHVHYGNQICYNGNEQCLEFVDEQKFTGPDTPKGS